MATDLTALDLAIAVSISGSSQKGLDISTPQDSISMTKSLAYAFGTGALKSNQVWHDRRLLAGAATEGVAIDFAATLLNAYGVAITFATVKALVVFNRSDETIVAPAHTPTDADISVGGALATEWQGPFLTAVDAIKIPAGGMFVIAANDATGWVVGAGASDILLITNEDAVDEACYDIYVIGESA